MKHWPTKLLGELCEFRHGNTPSKAEIRNWGGSFPWVSPKDMRAEIISDTQDHLSSEAIANNRAAIAKKNSLLVVVRSGILTHTFPVAIAERDVAFNQDLKAIRVVSSATTPRYIFRFLQASSPQILTHGTKRGATVHSLQSGFLELLQAPMPPLAEQERIVKLLDEADELRKLRAQADRHTATLIPSLFHEMFGELALNPFGWPVECVGTLFDVKRGGAKCGPFGSALKKHEYVASGIPVWGIPNVLPNQFVEAGSLFISPSKFEELRAYAVEPGDLLFSRAGTVGRICVANPKENDSIIGTNLIRLALDRKRVVPEFFATLMTHFGAEVGRLRANADESAYSFMNTTILKALRIYLPPIKLQEEFAAGVSEIRAMQAEQSTTRRRLDDLFQSLLHRAFKGEL